MRKELPTILSCSVQLPLTAAAVLEVASRHPSRRQAATIAVTRDFPMRALLYGVIKKLKIGVTP